MSSILFTTLILRVKIGKFRPKHDGVKLCYKCVSFAYVSFLLKNVGKMVRKSRSEERRVGKEC